MSAALASQRSFFHRLDGELARAGGRGQAARRARLFVYDAAARSAELQRCDIASLCECARMLAAVPVAVLLNHVHLRATRADSGALLAQIYVDSNDRTEGESLE